MPITIISENTTSYSAVIPDNPHIVEITAAKELASYIKKIFGIDLPIWEESTFSGKGIYIGHTRYAKENGICGDSKENWIIKTQGDNLILTGGANKGDRGVLYSVYHFLEDIAGVRWWNKWHEYIPEITKLCVDSNLYLDKTPAFSYRKILAHKGIRDFYYEARTRGNVIMEDDGLEGLHRSRCLKPLGGAKHMGEPEHVHSLRSYCPKSCFDEHPEWFAWDASLGKRTPHTHFCLTNEGLFEEVLKQLTQYIEIDMAECEKSGIEPACFYSISFPDVLLGFCQCEKCKVLEKKAGPSGYALYFVNKIARAVAKKYPHVKIETLAYASYIEPPKDDTLPEKNVIIRLANVYVDLIHGITKKGNANYYSYLKAWSNICKKSGSTLYIWEYMYHFFIPYPMPIAYRLCDTFRAFKDYGVDGIFVENQGRTTCLWELNQYMLLHLCENPYTDEEYLINDFVTKFFGKASKYMRAYLDELKNASERNEYSVYCIVESMHFNYLDAKAVIKCYELLHKALEAVKDDEYLTLKILWEQKLLCTQILIKYADLKKMAERESLKFVFEKKSLLEKILNVLEIVKGTLNFTNYYSSINKEFEYFSSYNTDDDILCLPPAELSELDCKDIYQFHYKNLYRHFSDAKSYGFTFEEDAESSLGTAGCVHYDTATDPVALDGLFITSKKDDNPHPVKISIQQDGKIIGGLDLYLEDIIPNKYNLYKIGTVSGIMNSADTRLNIFGVNFDWFSLTGVSVVFPIDKCEVYMSMKFAGPMYGGNINDENSVSIDRIVVVRKNNK